MVVDVLAVLLCVALTWVAGATTPFYGVSAGRLSTLSHQVGGDVYIVDDKRIRLKHFVYDGQGPAAYFWVGQKGVSGSTPDQSGVLVPDENGRQGKLGRYDDADVVLTLPSPLTSRDVRWLSIWCEEFAVNFGDVAFPSNVQVPRPTVVGQFTNDAVGLHSGNVTVLDVNTINVKAFTCSCQQSDAQIVIDFFEATSVNMVTFQQESSASLDTAKQLRVSLTVPEPNTVMDFDFISVYSSDSNMTLTRLALPSPLYVPPNLSGSNTKYYGVHVGRLPTLAHAVTGDVYVVDSKHFLIKNFVYDGTAPAAYFWVGKRGAASPTPDQATGRAVPDETNRLTRAYRNEDVTVTLPETLDVDDILWLSVWCVTFEQNFGHVIVPKNIQVPQPVVVGQLSDSVYGVSSGTVTVIDSRTITVDAFTCQCSHTGIQFVGGRNAGMTGNAVRLQHRKTPYDNLDTASRLNVNLTIPRPNNVHDYNVLRVHSFHNDRTLARIALPSTLLVPPYFGRDG